MADQLTPARRGVAKTLTLSREAVEALLALTPSKNNQGRIVSQLLLNEVVRREERARLKGRLLEVLEDKETVCL